MSSRVQFNENECIALKKIIQYNVAVWNKIREKK